MKTKIVHNPDGLYEVMRRRAISYDKRHAMAAKRRMFCAAAISLDSLLVDDNGTPRENTALGDGEAGARRIRACGRSPLWLELFGMAYAMLNEKERRIADALMQDRRVSSAARIAGTNRLSVYRTIVRLRRHFAAAYAAWRKEGVF